MLSENIGRHAKFVMRKLASAILTAALLITMLTVSYASAAFAYMDSGCKNVPNLSKDEITDLLTQTEIKAPDSYFVKAPSISSPYSPGELNPEIPRMLTARLNAWRKIAGLSPVTLDPGLTEQAQYGAVLEAAMNQYAHKVSKPSDMSDSFYEKGSEALHSCNLYRDTAIGKTIDGFMNDIGEINMQLMGHRRWQLNPSMGRTGFGYASASCGTTYLTEWAFDTSQSVSDYDFISWPASGNFPNNTYAFQNTSAWTVSVNESIYQKPDIDNIKVTLIRANDGKIWSFTKKDSGTKAIDGNYMYVDTQNAGIPNCIIFHPANVSSYDGTYTVKIDGLRYRSGAAASIQYQVSFFDTGEYCNTFKDVPTTYWGYEFIERAYADGIVSGVSTSPRLFAPNDSVTVSQFAAILVNSFYEDDIVKDNSGPWYQAYMDTAQKRHLLDGISSKDPSQVMSRYDMAQMLKNALSDNGAVLTQRQKEQAAKQITDWSSIPEGYRDAVAACVHFSIVTGVGNGVFDGSAQMNRAQAATVYCRMADALS